MIDAKAVDEMRATAHQPTTPADCKTAIIKLLYELFRIAAENAALQRSIERLQRAERVGP